MARFTYVDMRCELDQKVGDKDVLIEGVTVAPIDNCQLEALFDCYAAAFGAGDAQFYQLQSEGERRRYYYQELGFPDVLINPASFAYRIEEEIIGFALVLRQLENNYHISCMCISPEYQNRGLGTAMLNRIKDVAIENGCQSITLGTEPGMRAFHLYRKNGFEVTEEHSVEI
jgi:ribosomal protein S18 acetylase RimI-like enzyme